MNDAIVTKVLVMEFADEDGNKLEMTVKHPLDDLSLETVSDAMDGIIDAGIVQTAKGLDIETAVSAYYKVTTKTPIVSPEMALKYNIKNQGNQGNQGR